MRQLTGSVEQQASDSPRKIVVVGTSGCGKNFLGQHLSQKMGCRFIDLDDLYWRPGWTAKLDEEFVPLVEQAVASKEWVIAGNYSRTRSMIWSKADLIIWLDLSLPRCLWQALRRSMRRILSREACCNGNYETLRRLLGSPSILLWIWNTHARRRKDYRELFESCHNPCPMICLSSTREVNRFIHAFKN